MRYRTRSLSGTEDPYEHEDRIEQSRRWAATHGYSVAADPPAPDTTETHDSDTWASVHGRPNADRQFVAQFRELARAVIARAMSDACGHNIYPNDHPWVEEYKTHDGITRYRRSPWLREKLRGVPLAQQSEVVRDLMIADARHFLLSDEAEDERGLWFSLAGLIMPDKGGMGRALTVWKPSRTSSST